MEGIRSITYAPTIVFSTLIMVSANCLTKLPVIELHGGQFRMH